MKRGFSLIEVNMAILVVAGGILSLFALFPAGLRMSTMAIADMRHAMFVNEVFSHMQANASKITDIDRWMNPEVFWGDLCKGEGTTPGGFWTEMARKVDPSSPFIEMKLGALQGNANSHRYAAAGEMKTYFASKSGYVAAPARFKVRLHRQRPTLAPGVPTPRRMGLYRQTIDSRSPQLDLLAWRISMIVSDQPDVVFDENPTYHLELRFPGEP